MSAATFDSSAIPHLERASSLPPADLAAPRLSSDSCSDASNATAAGSPASSPAHEVAQAPVWEEDPRNPPMGLPPAERVWMYHLVTFPSYFTPCGHCCSGNRTPKREQLITHFDTLSPYQVFCSHCPEYKHRAHTLLQIRRSAFKDVVKASDIARYGCDTTGVQQYTLNGSKVVYLSREASAEKKGSSSSGAPASCIVDGRAMMDRTSLYCSIKCKLQHEDPRFTAWLDEQDPALLAAAYAAQNAPPRPTVASKRGSSGYAAAAAAIHQHASSYSSGGAASFGAGGDNSDSSSADGGASSRQRVKKLRVGLSGAAVASSFRPAPPRPSPKKPAVAKPKMRPALQQPAAHRLRLGGGAVAMLAGPRPDLKPIRTRLPGGEHATPFQAASLTGGDESMLFNARGEFADFDLDHAVSSSMDWKLPGSPLLQAQDLPPRAASAPASAFDAPIVGSPSFADHLPDTGLAAGWGEAGATAPLSPVLGAGGGSSGSSGEDWWLDGGADLGFAGFGDDVLQGLAPTDAADADTLLDGLPAFGMAM